MNQALQAVQHLALDGHVASSHPLSPHTALRQLPAITRSLVGYQPDTLWQIETALLPSALQALRRRSRDFARRELAPHALAIDSLPHWQLGELPPALATLLAEAGRAGWLSDLLPRPFGCKPPANPS